MDASFRQRLGIKPGNKVCLFHARKSMLPVFMQGDLELMLDWAEEDCDAILYWVQPGDDVGNIMSHLERQIKRTGRIWLVYKKEESSPRKGEKTADDDSLKQLVVDATSLVYSGVLAFGEGEYGAQYMFHKTARREQDNPEYGKSKAGT